MALAGQTKSITFCCQISIKKKKKTLFSVVKPEIIFFSLTSYFQRGHIYTSSGSFFIQPVENYTNENPNILHKISREKLPIKRIDLKNTDSENKSSIEKNMVDNEDQSNALNDSLSKEDELDDDDLRESQCDTCNSTGECENVFYFDNSREL